MRAVPVLDASSLPTLAFKSRSPLFWAAIAIMVVEGTMFFLLIASYFYVRLMFAGWPPPGHNIPGLWLPTLNLLILLASCPPSWWATEGAIAADAAKMRNGLSLNLALTIVALVLRIVEWRMFNFNWSASIYGSLIWTMLGLHTFDFGVGGLVTAVILAKLLAGSVDEKLRGAVDFDSYTWYFLVAIWIPLYATIYIAPYVMRRV